MIRAERITNEDRRTKKGLRGEGLIDRDYHDNAKGFLLFNLAWHQLNTQLRHLPS